MRIYKYIWVREGGKYRKLCRNPEYQEEPCSAVDVMKAKFHNRLEDIKESKKCEKVRKWPEVTRDSYAIAKEYEKRIIEGIMSEEEGAQIYLRVMPEMLVVGKTIRMIRVKDNERGKEVDEILRSMMKGESCVR